MAAALARFSSVFTDWVPDLSGLSPRSQVVLGGLLALLFHLLLVPLAIGLMLLSELVFPHHEEPAPPPAQGLKVEIMPPKPETAPVPRFEDHRHLIDPRGLEASTVKPEKATLESSQDMLAGAQKAPTGLLPLPSQDGREDRKTDDFTTQDVHIGAIENAAAAVTAPPTPAVEQPAAPPPLYQPKPVPRAALAAAAKAPPDQKLPDPAVTVRATPPPLEKVAMLRPDQVALMKPPEETAPEPIQKTEAATPVPRTGNPKDKEWMPMMSTPKPLVPLPSRQYQEYMDRTHVDGANPISNNAPGVDAVSTPVGRWWMMTKRAIGKNWDIFLKQDRDLLSTGSVRVNFRIDEEGKVLGLHIEAGSGNHALDETCLQAIRETAIPAPPRDVLAPLPNRQMEQDVTFNYY